MQRCRKMPLQARWTAGAITLLLAAVLGGCAQAGSLRVVSAVRAAHIVGSAPSAWSAPELVPAHELGTGPPQPPAFDANGDAVAVWTESPRSISEVIAHVYPVRSAVRPASGRWQPPDTLSGYGGNPEVAVDARGDAIAVWESPSGVEATTRPAGGTWLASETVATTGGEEPQVASAASGDAIVVWPRQSRRGSTGIEAAVWPAGGPRSPAQTISARENAFHPRIAMNARGDALVAWELDSSRGCVVRAAFRPVDGRWSTPRAVSHESCGGNHRVAIDVRGDAIVVWVAQRGELQFVESAERTAGGRWTPRRIIGRAPVIQEPPQVGMDNRGDAIAVWSEPAFAKAIGL